MNILFYKYLERTDLESCTCTTACRSNSTCASGYLRQRVTRAPLGKSSTVGFIFKGFRRAASVFLFVARGHHDGDSSQKRSDVCAHSHSSYFSEGSLCLRGIAKQTMEARGAEKQNERRNCSRKEEQSDESCAML